MKVIILCPIQHYINHAYLQININTKNLNLITFQG